MGEWQIIREPDTDSVSAGLWLCTFSRFYVTPSRYYVTPTEHYVIPTEHYVTPTGAEGSALNL